MTPGSAIRALLTAVMPLVATVAAATSLPAFPGAEGFGATAAGGRGGRIVKVTNLDPDGPGSLQAACAAEGPRIVVFDVGGVIRGDVIIRHSAITIAGQTAPAPGITLEGRLLVRPEPWRRLHDIVVRFLRIRVPPGLGDQGDAVQFPDTERVMLDHLSLAWASDETVDLIHASEVTLQWSTIEESDVAGHPKGAHNFGVLSAYPGSGNVSIHHNLFAHHSRRLPSLSPYVAGKPGDFRNNVVYNFREALTHDGHVPREAINLVANYYKRGPSATRVAPFAFHRSGRYFVDGNVVEDAGSVEDLYGRRQKVPSWLGLDAGGVRLDRPAIVAPVTTTTAQESLGLVLARAGAFPRDRVTLRTLEEVWAGTGEWGRRGPAKPGDRWYVAGLPHEPPLDDGDGDGMSDAWEEANGLDKRNGDDHRMVLPSGYTAIETYLNERAAAVLARGSQGEQHVVLLGASYVRGWPVHELAGRRVVNRGVAGERSEEMLARFERDVAGSKPVAVVIWGYINDIHSAPIVNREHVLAGVRRNIEAMVRLARAHGIRPVLATEVTLRERDDLPSRLRAWWGRLRNEPGYLGYVNASVLRTNAWIRQYGAEQGIAVLDVEQVLSDERGVRHAAYATPDGSHITAAAYERLTADAEQRLARLFDR